MLRRLWLLFCREIAASRSLLLLVAGFMVLWDLFLLTRVGKWPGLLPEQLALWPAFLLLPWMALGPIQSWHREWQQGSVHYTMAFPLPGWSLVLTKGLAAMLETGFLGIVALVAGLPVYGRVLFSQLEGCIGDSAIWKLAAIDILKAGVLVGLPLFAIGAVVQWAYLMGMVARKFQGLVAPLAALSGIWLMLRVGGLLSPALAWVPPAVFALPVRTGLVYQVTPQFLGLAPVISATLFGLLLWGMAGWLVDRQVDI